ncbi:hypothetical protein SAMN05444280_11649 [Tangfeifania diversioriginum]|uniref:Uncharacterized protein n=1 Tax=Tangfeifania diversioriginum TaxID=1168035 RepID=A0A1M6ICY2_9BACT|nr:hypothetical protein [Tangfeifania diversioriginum]SHJ32267.1 hypothetical protein SAMN05444280_11649 [Tangfeifania diversioriginum]
MDKRKIHFNGLLVGTIFLTIFALFPCDVKDPLFKAIDIEYNRPLNKNKTALFEKNSCENDFSDELNAIKAQSTGNNQLFIFGEESIFSAPFYTNNQNTTTKSIAVENPYNYPAMYILYKRLKFDLFLRA